MKYPPILPISLALVMSSGIALANDKKQFNIPAQNLSESLLNYSDTTGVKILFNENLARNIKTEQLKGVYSTEEALKKLLGASGLNYRFTSPKAVVVNQPEPDSRSGQQLVAEAPKEPGTTTLKAMTVVGEAVKDVHDPYNPDYVLPNATSGTKTDTPVMETPLNVQVISKQVLKDQQVIQLDQALKNVSGVTTSKDIFGTNNLTLRGFQNPALFRNGVRFDSNAFGDAQQFANVENMEVLKGPAAILYGRVEPGGMVNVITKQPLAKPYYSLNQQFGSYDLYRTSVDATGPLTKDDTFLYRVNASFQSNNSFRELISSENVFFAPILKWNISPRTQATLEMEYQHQNANMDFQSLPFDQTRNSVIDNISHNRNLGEPNPEETENIFVGFFWSHQFNDDWSIKHQVAFKRNDVHEGYGLLPFNIDLAKRTVDRIAFRGHFQEDTIATIIDLNGHFKTWGLEHNLLFGGDYYRLDVLDGASSGFDTVSTISLDNPIHPGSPGPILAENTNPTTQGTDNYGLYLQDQIKLPYGVFVTGGLRYQYASSANDSGFGPGGSDSSATVDDAVTPRVGLLWQPRKWLSLYSNYIENFGAQTGERAYVEGSSPSAAGVPIAPQTAQQWEVGAKTEWFNGRLRATLAYYNLTKQNVATADRAHPIPYCAGAGCSIAVGEIYSSGPELDIQGEIFTGWNLITTYANQDVRITKSNNGDVGNRLQFVPRNVGSFWTTYEIQHGSLKGFKIGGGVNFQDSAVDSTNTIKSPGYALVSLMTGYSFEVGKSKITAQLNVDNLLDKTYFSSAAPFGTNSSNVNFSTPRTLMGSINVQY